MAGRESKPEGSYMASHRLADVLRSTGRLSDHEIEHMGEDEGWQWLRANRPADGTDHDYFVSEAVVEG